MIHSVISLEKLTSDGGSTIYEKVTHFVSQLAVVYSVVSIKR